MVSLSKVHDTKDFCFLTTCSATHPFRTTKPKIRILGIVVRKGCVALHYSVHFFYGFSLSHNDRNRGGGYRRKICTVPTPLLCLPDPLQKMMGSNSGPCVSGCVHRYRWLHHPTMWEPYRSCADTLHLDYDRCAKEKNRKKKSGRSSVVLRTLSVLHRDC